PRNWRVFHHVAPKLDIQLSGGYTCPIHPSWFNRLLFWLIDWFFLWFDWSRFTRHRFVQWDHFNYSLRFAYIHFVSSDFGFDMHPFLRLFQGYFAQPSAPLKLDVITLVCFGVAEH